MRKTSGFSLILLIFLTLCLTVFSLLSLSGAMADHRLSSRAADRTSEYYRAVSAANRVLADIDLLLLDSSLETAVSENERIDLYTRIPDSITSANHPELTGAIQYLHTADSHSRKTSGTAHRFSFDIYISEEQSLHVTILLHDPVSASEFMYDITEWKIIHTRPWNADRSQNLLRLDSGFLPTD